MSSLKFDATINTEKLYEELKKANQSFEEFAKAGQKSGEAIDKTFQKSTVDLKQQLTQQKQYIKELSDEIKKLENTREGTSGSQRSNINKELGNLRSDLNKETAIMQNLQKESVAGNQKEAESQGELFQSLGKWAIGMATVATAMKIAKDIIASTEGTAKQFEFAVAGAESGLSFFWKTIATGDWSNFTDNMQKAISVGYEYAQMMHDVKESTWALELKESGKIKENAQLEINLRDRTLTPEQNVEAGKKRIENEEKLAEERTKVAKKTVDAAELIAVERSKIDAETLQGIIRMTDEETRVKAEAYNKQLAIATSKGGNLLITPEMTISARGEVSKAPAEVKLYADALRGYGGLKEEMIVNYKNALVAFDKADASALTGTKRLRTMLSSREVEIKKEAEDAAKKAKEDAELDNRIKATQELMKTASGERLKQLAEEYVALLKLKKANEDLVNQAIMLAQDPTMAGKDGVLPLMTMKTGGTVTSKLATKIDSKEAKNDLIDTTKKSIAENIKAGKDLEKDQDEADKKKKENLKNILNASMNVTMELGKQLGLSEKELGVMGGIFDSVSSLMSGDMFGAAAGMVSMMIQGISDIFGGGNGPSEYELKLENINKLLEEQQRIIEKAARYGGESDAIKQRIKLLNDEKTAMEAKLASLGKTAELIGVGTKMEADLEKLNNDIADTQQALDDLMSGGVTQNTIADSIAQGFKEGKTSVNDFADYMNTVLLDAVMNIFKGDILADMQPLMDKVRASLGDKKLTKEEKDAITTEAKRVADENQGLWKDLTGALDLTGGAAKQTGMSGTIAKSITEETGTELAGLFRRNADDTRIVRDFTKAGVTHLMAIEANTGETVIQLKLAVVELQSIVSNTKSVYSGKIGG